MSPIFTPEFSTVDANIPMFEGRAQVQITKRTPFHKSGKVVDGNVKTNDGVQVNLEIVGLYDDEGELDTAKKGKTVSPYKVWLHTEGGWGFAKPFMMAAGGYRRNEEAKANEKLFQKNDWTCVGELDAAAETFEVGSGWDLLVGKVVDVTLTIKRQPSKTDPDEVYENQEFSGWAPVAS